MSIKWIIVYGLQAISVILMIFAIRAMVKAGKS